MAMFANLFAAKASPADLTRNDSGQAGMTEKNLILIPALPSQSAYAPAAGSSSGPASL